MNRVFFVTGSIMAGLAVAASAYGAHAGADFNSQQMIWMEKATRLQIYHGLALICVSLAITHWRNSRLLFTSGCLFLLGIICFSGGLYSMIFIGINPGYVIPFGGLAFIAGWALMALFGLLINQETG